MTGDKTLRPPLAERPWRGLQASDTRFSSEALALRRVARGLLAAGVLAVVGVVTVAALSVRPGSPASPRPPAVVADLELQPMLQGHAAKIQQFRVARPDGRMTAVVLSDPMRRDWSPRMVVQQEAYMAQLDRMVARR